MRSILMIITLMTGLVSCGGKVNNLSKVAGVSTLEYAEDENISTIQNIMIKPIVEETIPHDENKSIFRKKLLNLIVEQTFPSQEKNPQNILKKNDEIYEYKMSERDLRNYQEKERDFSKVIVSYMDREEVYFFPEGIVVENLINEFELTADTDRVLKMLPADNKITTKGGVFYFVSLNHFDLIKNDKDFFSSQTNMIGNVANQSIVIDSYKSVLMSIDYNVYLQKVLPQSFGGKLIKCTRDLIEAGMCGPQCSYKRNLPSSEFEKINEDEIEKLGLSVRYGNFAGTIKDLNIINKKTDHFEVKIESQEGLGDSYILSIQQAASRIYPQSAPGYDYSANCSSSDRNVNGDVPLQSKVNYSVKLTTFGRGAELFKIKL